MKRGAVAEKEARVESDRAQAGAFKGAGTGRGCTWEWGAQSPPVGLGPGALGVGAWISPSSHHRALDPQNWPGPSGLSMSIHHCTYGKTDGKGAVPAPRSPTP